MGNSAEQRAHTVFDTGSLFCTLALLRAEGSPPIPTPTHPDLPTVSSRADGRPAAPGSQLRAGSSGRPRARAHRRARSNGRIGAMNKAANKGTGTRGVPLRCVARVNGATDGRDVSGIFIAGNRLELVPAGQTEGEQYDFSRVFDTHASDKEVCEGEMLPLVSHLTSGSNVHIVTSATTAAGTRRWWTCRRRLIVGGIFDQMQQRQAVAGGQGAQLSFTLTARIACVVIGSPDSMTDLLAPGSSELRIVRDAEAVGGVQLAGLRSAPLSQSADFVGLFKSARSRLFQQHKPPAPSSVLWLELTQTSQRPGARVGGGGAGVAAGADGRGGGQPRRRPRRRAPLHPLHPAHAPAAARGRVAPAERRRRRQRARRGRRVRDAVGRGRVVGDARAAAQAMPFRNFPLTNDGDHARPAPPPLLAHADAARAARRRREQAHAERRADRLRPAAATQSARRRDRAAAGARRLDAAGRERAGERAAAADGGGDGAARTKLNSVSGECISLKEELMAEKKEKLALSKQLVDAQLERV